jgi:hypothetical protein
MNPCTNGMLNCNDTIGQTIVAMTTQTTGDLFITLLFSLIILLAIAMLFGIRLEYTAILILPLLLAFMVVTKDFFAVGSVILIYLAIVLTGNFILK